MSKVEALPAPPWRDTTEVERVPPQFPEGLGCELCVGCGHASGAWGMGMNGKHSNNYQVLRGLYSHNGASPRHGDGSLGMFEEGKMEDLGTE